MKRQTTALALIFVLVLMLSGCSAGAAGTGGDRGREPENTMLAQVVGIDRSASGTGFLVTAAGSDGGEESRMESSEGETLEEAFDALQTAGDRWVNLSSAAHFMLGDGVNPEEVLTFILNDSGMSWRAKVWYAGSAASLMGEQEDGGIARLKVLEQSETGVVTVLEGLAELTQEGETALPVLTNQDGTLKASGKLYFSSHTKR